jgi:hypothetical protein
MLNKIIAENFPNLEKRDSHPSTGGFKNSNRSDQKRTSPCHIIVKTLGIQNKGRILKAAREMH